MKALRWYGQKDLRYEDIAEPSPGPGQVKVKIGLAGICGSDLKEYVDSSLYGESITVKHAGSPGAIWLEKKCA